MPDNRFLHATEYDCDHGVPTAPAIGRAQRAQIGEQAGAGGPVRRGLPKD